MSCGQLITDCIRALQGDSCQLNNGWKCTDCLNMPGKFCVALVTEAGSKLKWFCDSCEQVGTNKKPLSTETDCKLEKVMLLMQAFLDRVEHIDDRFDEKTDVAFTSQLEAVIKNTEDRLMQMEDIMQKHEEKVALKKMMSVILCSQIDENKVDMLIYKKQ